MTTAASGASPQTGGPATRKATVALPGPLSLGLARGGTELRQFFRHKEQVVFTFSLPAVLMVLLGSILDGIPESFVLGLTVLQGAVSLPLLAGISLSNSPRRSHPQAVSRSPAGLHAGCT